MKKEIIVARVNMAGTRIFKSYITNVKLVETSNRRLEQKGVINVYFLSILDR